MKLKLISCIAFILAGIVVLVMTFSGYAEQEEVYATYLSKARNNAEKELPYNAYQNYQSAFAIQCEDEEVYKEFVAQAELLGGDFYMNAVNKYIELFPESSNAYELLCKWQYDTRTYKDVITTALEANTKGIATTVVRDLYFECFYMLQPVKSGFDDAQSFLGSTARVQIDDKYGFVTYTGGYLLAPLYEQASTMMGTDAAVYDGERWFMINSAGYAVARPDTEVDSLSFLSGGKIRVSKGGKYGYMGTDMVVPSELPYDYASNFRKGIAAVKKGDKWALINTSEQLITEYIFEDVLLDEYETCITESVIFAKYNGKYYLVGTDGNKISEQGFDDAYPFAGTEPAAVCVNGKWGFVDTVGNMVLEPQYSDAKSFSQNLGAVCVEGLWGYISTGGEFRIECQFEDCKPFASSGIAAVKEDGFWNYVQLLGYDS